MLRFILILLSALAVTGCSGPRYVDYFPYFDDGTAKPKVAILPIIDSTNSCLDWSFGEEVAQGIDYEFMNSGQFYVLSPREIGPVWNKISEIDLSDNDIAFTKEFRNTDFIVILELIDRSVEPCDASQTLSMSVRVKVMDIRCARPKVILFEVYKSSYMSTLSHGDVDGNGACWGTAAYAKTCCGLAHQRLIKGLSQRLEEVIWGAK